MEIFNIEYNNKKNNSQKNLILNKNTQDKITINNTNNYNTDDNKYININMNLSRTTSKIFHDMEDKVFLALKGQRQNFIRRHWIISSIILLLIIIILCYVFF